MNDMFVLCNVSPLLYSLSILRKHANVWRWGRVGWRSGHWRIVRNAMPPSVLKVPHHEKTHFSEISGHQDILLGTPTYTNCPFLSCRCTSGYTYRLQLQIIVHLQCNNWHDLSVLLLKCIKMLSLLPKCSRINRNIISHKIFEMFNDIFILKPNSCGLYIKAWNLSNALF